MNRTTHFMFLALLVAGCSVRPEPTTTSAPGAPASAVETEKPAPEPLPALRPIEEETLLSSVSFWMTPHDHSSHDTRGAPQMVVGVRGVPVRQGIRALRAIAGDVRLLTWPELTPVDAKVEVVAAEAYEPTAEVDATAAVHPVAPLAPGAYVLAVRPGAVKLVPVSRTDLATLPDGSLGARFEVRAAAPDSERSK